MSIRSYRYAPSRPGSIGGLVSIGETAVTAALGEPICSVQTRSGGRHLFYRGPDTDPVGNARWRYGDVRGSAGFVVVWDPAALVAAVRCREWHKAVAVGRLPERWPAGFGPARVALTAEGARSNTLNEEVFKDARHGRLTPDAETAYQLAGETCGLPTRDVAATIASVIRSSRRWSTTHRSTSTRFCRMRGRKRAAQRVLTNRLDSSRIGRAASDRTREHRGRGEAGRALCRTEVTSLRWAAIDLSDGDDVGLACDAGCCSISPSAGSASAHAGAGARVDSLYASPFPGFRRACPPFPPVFPRRQPRVFDGRLGAAPNGLYQLFTPRAGPQRPGPSVSEPPAKRGGRLQHRLLRDLPSKRMASLDARPVARARLLYSRLHRNVLPPLQRQRGTRPRMRRHVGRPLASPAPLRIQTQ